MLPDTPENLKNGRPRSLDDRDGRWGELHLRVPYRLRATRDVFEINAPELISVIETPSDRPAQVLTIMDQGLHEAQPDLLRRVESYLRAHEDRVTPAGSALFLPGGEAAKNDPALIDEVLSAIHERGICRHSYVLAIGGGAVLDAAGFAAATAHRGVRLIRLPSTTLAQGDAGVGVKNGVNRFGKKNFLGTFAVPWAVINDFNLLRTLSGRDWRCGFSEAVKVALVKDAGFFRLIESSIGAINDRDLAVAGPIIQRSAELHLKHILSGGDPFELTTARPLDFGHWAAHKLEQMTSFDLRHGEAVAIGLALDVVYAERTGLLAAPDRERILACLLALGFDLHHPALHETETLLEGLDEFREHLGGRLTIALINGIGEQSDVHEIDPSVVREAIDDLSAGGLKTGRRGGDQRGGG